MDKKIQLKSGNIVLRIPSLEDIPYIFSATKFKGFNDGMAWEAPDTQDELKEPYHKNIKSWEEGVAFSFTIEEKVSQIFYGRISIRRTDIENRWNIGFWTHPKHQNKGIMSEAVSIVLKFGFEKLHADVIEAYHAIWNKGSEKVLKRNGFNFVSYVEKGFKKDGVWVEENLLAIEKMEWEVLKNR